MFSRQSLDFKYEDKNPFIHFIKFPLQSSFVDEDWVTDNIPIQEMEEEAAFELTISSNKHYFFRKLQIEKKIKNYEVKSWFIYDLIIDFYRIPGNQLIVDLLYKACFETHSSFYNDYRIPTVNQIYGTVHIQVATKDKRIISRNIVTVVPEAKFWESF